MTDNDTSTGTQQSVVAIVKEDGVLKGIELRRRNGATEILWSKSAESPDANWQSFAAECGLSVRSAVDQNTESDRTVVVGFSSAGTIFHRTSVPPVDQQEVESIVKLQAETRLPLPADQTELAWRADPAQNGEIGVTMVVARKALLQEFVRNVRPLDPAKILLDCEGTIKAWRTVFSEYEKEAVVVSMAARSTQVCLARHGRLSNAVILDVGSEDFSAESQTEQLQTTEKIALDIGIGSSSAETHEGRTEITERFVRDMRSVMNLFGFAEPEQVPVLVLSNDSTMYVSIVSALRSAELDARVVLPNVRTLTAQGESGVQWIYDYRAAIGLGLMALEDGTDDLNIFQKVYSRVDARQERHWIYSPKVAGAIACAMLLALGIVSYAIDLKNPKSIMQRLEGPTSEAKTDLDALVERQRLIRTVGRERPDMLALLKLINDCGKPEDGRGRNQQAVLLNSISFKKGQKITITGQVQNSEQLYKFQESLDKNKDITDVKIPNTGRVTSRSGGPSGGRPSAGPPGPPGRGDGPPDGPPNGPPGGPPGGPGGGSRNQGGITFTITFHYKNFTKKTAGAQS